MKTKQWLFAALTALLLAGCSSEIDLTHPDEDVNPPVPEGMTQLSFEIKGVRTGTSYAGATAPLTEDESQLKDMIVILFPQGAGGKPLPADVATTVLKAKIGKTAQGAPKAEVLIDKTVGEGTYYAVIMANLGACFDGRIDVDHDFESVYNMIKGKTYETLFVASSRDKLTYRGYTEYISVKDFGLAMKALATGIKVAAVADRGDNIALTATMKRPMARFDIKNSAWQSFTITGYRPLNVHTFADLCPSADDVPNWADDDNPVTNGMRETYSPERSNQINFPSDHDNDPLTPAVITYTPGFYLCPGQAADKSAVEISGELEVGGKVVPLTLTIPFVTGTPPSETPIAITANKRYKIELTLSQGNNDVVGSVILDGGAWDEGDGTGGDNLEQKLPGEILDPSAGTTYTDVNATNGTFTAPEGATEFSFRLVATSNVIKVADGADGGIIIGIMGASTLAPSTNYTVQMTATGTTGKLVEMGTDKDGKPVVVKTYTVNRKELAIPDNIYPPTMTAATLVGDVYWAPVDVGATSPDEPGRLFQFGRLSSWSSAQAALDALEYRQITIADAEAVGNKDVYFCSNGGSDINWWTDTSGADLDATFARWNGVSDGITHPCPKGWRLPTVAEAQVLEAAKNDMVFTDISTDPKVQKASVLGVSFIVKDAIKSWRGGDIWTGAYFSWLASENGFGSMDIRDYIKMNVNNHYPGTVMSANGYSIRCVKTKTN